MPAMYVQYKSIGIRSRDLGEDGVERLVEYSD